MDDRAYVKNAADPEQVRRAGRKERQGEARRRDLYRAVLRTEAGRALLWDLLERTHVFRSIWRASAEIHYLAGRQDFGHELLADLTGADEDLYQLMEREARAYLKHQQAETDASHTPRADTGVHHG